MIEALLFTAPLLLVFGPLLAGRYPGEKALSGDTRLGVPVSTRAETCVQPVVPSAS